jgi:hypothetical protein
MTSPRNFPKTIDELGGMVLRVECLTPACAGRQTQIHPLPSHYPALNSKLTMAEVLARCRCTQCRSRPYYLILALEGRGEKGHVNRDTPRWLFGRDGIWREIPESRIDADWHRHRTEMLRRSRR